MCCFQVPRHERHSGFDQSAFMDWVDNLLLVRSSVVVWVVDIHGGEDGGEKKGNNVAMACVRREGIVYDGNMCSSDGTHGETNHFGWRNFQSI